MRRGLLFFTLTVMTSISIWTASCKSRPKNSARGSDLADETTAAGATWRGHADHRLIFVGHSGPDFDPNQDLLMPSDQEQLRDEIAQSMRAAGLKSMIPIMGQLTGHASGTEPDFMGTLMALAGNARQSLATDLRSVFNVRNAQFPQVSEAWLLPWPEEPSELFYDADKISASPTRAANVVKTLPGSENFPPKFNELVRIMQNARHAKHDEPAYLIAARYFLFVMPGRTRLTVRLLIGLNPTAQPFVKEDEQVKFSKLVVPGTADTGITAAVTIEIPIDDGKPTLHLAFGEFKGLEKGIFVVEEQGRAKKAPRLEGQLNKRGAGWVALDFAFQELTFDLATMQVENLSALVSPGIKIGGTKWTVGGIRASSVDQAFQTEINNTIDGQIRSAINSGNQAILDGALSKEDIEKAFNKIFRRG